MGFDPKLALADIDRVRADKGTGGGGTMAVAHMAALISACADRNTPPASSYRMQMERALVGLPSKLDQMAMGTLTALRADYAAGVTPVTFEQLVHAEVFADLLGQAKYLLDGGYRLAAAVVGGAALEEHLRQLAKAHGVPTTNVSGAAARASMLNAELRKANAYSEMERTQVETWQKLRNDAAHLEPAFQNVTDQQVRDMLSGIQDFIVRHPA